MLEKEIKAFNDTIIEKTKSVPSIIYVDLRLIKDIFLGAILSKVQDKVKYDYLMSHIDVYNKRYIDDVELYLPELGVTNDEILTLYETSPIQIYNIAPSTTFGHMFNAYLIRINNKAAVHKDPIVPRLILNTYPLTLPNTIVIELCKWLAATYALDVRAISKPINIIDKDTFRKVEAMYLYDLHAFIEDPIYQIDLKNGVFDHLELHALKHVRRADVISKHKSLKELEQEFVFVESYMNFMCNFTFLPPITPLVDTKR